ncbi:GldM family protein [Hymenobacter daeguensis]
MQARFLLPTLWLLSLLPAPPLQAQGRPLGPWRMTHQWVIEGAIDAISDWGQGVTPGKKVLKLVPTPFRWNVVPDSIRLFLNCENRLIAPARPHKGQPAIHFTATGATVRLDAKKQRLLIAPFDSVVTLQAYKGRTLVSKHKFRAILPPMPLIRAWVRNSSNDFYCFGPQPDSAFYYFELSINARPDESFMAFMPTDARYRVSRFKLTLLRGDTVIRKTQTINFSQAGIKISRDSVRLGNQIRFDVLQLQRMNSKGIIEKIPLQKTIFQPLPFR